jgi:hypothetical protein
MCVRNNGDNFHVIIYMNILNSRKHLLDQELVTIIVNKDKQEKAIANMFILILDSFHRANTL